ncbi:hypothetical protein [Actinophytocola sediminis]
MGVLVAAAGDCVLDDHPSTGAYLLAVSAVQGALEVVVVHPPPLSRGGPGVENGSDAVEQALVDEWLMAAVEFFAW